MSPRQRQLRLIRELVALDAHAVAAEGGPVDVAREDSDEATDKAALFAVARARFERFAGKTLEDVASSEPSAELEQLGQLAGDGRVARVANDADDGVARNAYLEFLASIGEASGAGGGFT